MPTLTLLIGLPGSGVSRIGEQITQEKNAHVIVNKTDLDILLLQTRQVLAEGRNAIVHAPLRAPRFRAPFLRMARDMKVTSEIIFVNSNLETILERISRFGQLSEEKVRKMYRHMKIPTYTEDVDQIQIWQDVQPDAEAVAFFSANERELVDNPLRFMRRLEQDGSLLKLIPEYKGTLGLDQHSPYHTYNVFDHIMLASSFVAGSNLKMVWTLLLHDLGKGFPQIKQFLGTVSAPYGEYDKKDKVVIENGERIRDGIDSGAIYIIDGKEIPKEYIKTDLVGHFYDHENVGAQLALGILPRIGYSLEFAHEVATLIQFHMTMPRNMDVIQPGALKKWYAKVGKYAPELMMVRMADDRAK